MQNPTSTNSIALEVRKLSKRFGSLQVTHDVNLKLAPGARHALIGPNGAGKTTFVNLITGVLKADSGQILLNGEDVTGDAEHQRARRGLARTFQINQLFGDLSTIDNVCLAIAERDRLGLSLFKPFGHNKRLIDEAMALLEQFNLVEDVLTPIRQLAYGRQRLVEIVIAIGQKPRVLLLDEPAAGVPSHESQLILDAIDHLSTETAILIIEHDMDVVFRFADEITVLASGEVLARGTPRQIADNRQVQDVYLGRRSA